MNASAQVLELELNLNAQVHRLDVGELLYRIDAEKSVAKVRVKTRKVVLELVKVDKGKKWKKLTAQ